MPADDPLRVPARLRARYDELVSRTDEIAKRHLNEEYADLCRRLAAVLARRRPSPLERGEPRTWAAGILYAVGWVNFLADPAQEPHMTTAELAEKAGVGESTIALRFRDIRQAIDLRRLDPEWTLPSRLADNPYVWILLVNGLPVDIRREPREVQEEAFRLGLIPFVPAAGMPDEEVRRSPTRAAPPEDDPGRGPPRGTGPRRESSDPETTPTDAGGVYQLRISLQELEPEIWRRVRVPADTTLAGLHHVIQAVMGWRDSHLWRFEIGGVEYGRAGEAARGIRDARRVRLNEVARPGDVLLYEYDFGDSWIHRVRVEKALAPEPGREYPVCVAAEYAAPPEDCGGPPGYVRLVEVLSDPSEPEHEELLRWVGGRFDPMHVDREEIDRRLALARTRGGGPDGMADAEEPVGNPAEAMMREAGELLRRALAENPGATPEDLNAVLQAASGEYNARSQPELGGLAPTQMHRLLSADWESPDSAVRLNASLTLAELEPSRTLHDARVLLEILGREGEVRATPKGNLPRAVVAEMRERLRPLPDSRDEWYRERKQVNEEDVRAVHLTRILLMLGGLVKRRKGVYSLTRAGSRLAEPERAGELFALLFRTHFRRLNLGYLDGVAPVPSFQRAVAFSLYRFGQVGERWMTPAELKESLVLPPTRRELPPGEHYDSLDTLLESRLLRPLEGFALAEVEVRPAEPGRWTDRHAYRRAGLFDRFLRFELDDPGAGARRG